MPNRDLVVIGASAGGLPALYAILGSLPPTLPAAVVVVVHTRSTGGVLPQVLGRRSALPVDGAADGAGLEPGRVYVAPADRHVLIGRRGLRVVRGPRENGFRPAVDPLFRTAARSRGPGVIGVILSGALDDGANGLSAIVRRGGIAIVQDPDDAEVPSMPLAALRLTQVHAVVPQPDRRRDRAVLPSAGRAGSQSMPRRDEPEPQHPSDDTQVADMVALNGLPSPITCPACGGALWETGRRVSSAMPAMSATSTRPTACSPSTARPSNRRCGPPSACSSSTPSCGSGCRSEPGMPAWRRWRGLRRGQQQLSPAGTAHPAAALRPARSVAPDPSAVRSKARAR